MSVNLTKGQSVSLVKQDGGGLTRVRMERIRLSAVLAARRMSDGPP